MINNEIEDNEETEELTRSDIIDVINDIKLEAKENHDEYLRDRKNEYYQTTCQTYYMVLDTIRNRIIMKDRDPADYGLGGDLEKEFL